MSAITKIALISGYDHEFFQQELDKTVNSGEWHDVKFNVNFNSINDAYYTAILIRRK
jgi:hypothetical protein